MSIEEIYLAKCRENSDICQHLPTLKAYAEKCNSIIELGLRSIVSTWAFLAGKPMSLISVDIHHPSYYLDYDPGAGNLDLAMELATKQKTDFKFIQEDSTMVKLPPCELMFFDTLHTYEQLKAELNAHGKNVSKYLIFHDTETYKEELIPAIKEYMNENPFWDVERMYSNNNGLMILKRLG